MSMSIIELMYEIVKEPAPRLCDVGPEGRFSAEAEGMFVEGSRDKENTRSFVGGFCL
jgi:mitogen-activated protein kinase kinase